LTLKQLLRSLLAPLLRPLTGFFNSRFSAVAEKVDLANAGIGHIRAVLEGAGPRSAEQEMLDVLGAQIARQRAVLESMEATQQDVGRDLGEVADHLRLERLPAEDIGLDQLSQRGADFLNRATGWRGFSAAAGLYVNDAINLRYEAGRVEVLNINERIVELPFVFREMAKVPLGSRVLDVGASESPVALGLATLGYDVTAADPRGYAFSHERVRTLSIPAQEVPADEPYDAVVLLSTIEHVGIGHYDDGVGSDADLAVMEHMRAVTTAGARLVLTTPFGEADQDDVQRIYDVERLNRLLDGWDLDTVQVVQRVSETEWRTVSDEVRLPVDQRFAVIMVSAVRSA
jgi:hypothetical protein